MTMSLRESLAYSPVELKFGTSGRRGLTSELTQLEIYLNVLAELDFLLALGSAHGGINPGDEIFFAYDLRPSSIGFMLECGGRGELAQAVVAAILGVGLKPVNLGAVPTPALAAYALDRHKASIMITGSHIPFDRNGYKLNTVKGELLKSHEALISPHTLFRRRIIYDQPAAESPFNEHGMFRDGHRDLPVVNSTASEAYIARLTGVFPEALSGTRLLYYEHSSVGRDLIPALLERLGAQVVRRERSEIFVPIDTESLGQEQLDLIQDLLTVEQFTGEHFDAVISCDGDADRPLLLAVDKGKIEFISGDLVGMLAAEYLQPDAIVVPISCNPAIDDSSLKNHLRPKTKIGSPFVIAGMQEAVIARGRRVCGWEANGGFLLGTDFKLNGMVLRSLPTRDAALPIVAALLLSKQKRLSLKSTVGLLPRRFGATALIKNFPRRTGLALIAELSPSKDRDESQVLFELRRRFVPALLEDIESANFTDGVRIYGGESDIIHFRPSGNADEFRIYAVSDSVGKAQGLASMAERFLLQNYR